MLAQCWRVIRSSRPIVLLPIDLARDLERYWYLNDQKGGMEDLIFSGDGIEVI